MATEGGHIDYMFLGPHYPAAGSATAAQASIKQPFLFIYCPRLINMDLSLILYKPFLVLNIRNI